MAAGPLATYSLAWWTADGGGVSYGSAGVYTLGGTGGQSDAAPPRTGGVYELHAGFWQASCTAALVPVTIARSGATITLSWTPTAPNQAYQVHRATAPYFIPSDATRVALVTAAPWSYQETVAPNLDVAYYVVRPVCGAAYVDAGRKGEFEFALVPGG